MLCLNASPPLPQLTQIALGLRDHDRADQIDDEDHATANIASESGIRAGVALASDTKVGIMPPSAKPIFQDKPVPLARSRSEIAR